MSRRRRPSEKAFAAVAFSLLTVMGAVAAPHHAHAPKISDPPITVKMPPDMKFDYVLDTRRLNNDVLLCVNIAQRRAIEDGKSVSLLCQTEGAMFPFVTNAQGKAEVPGFPFQSQQPLESYRKKDGKTVSIRPAVPPQGQTQQEAPAPNP